MNRRTVYVWLARVSALGFLGTAALHGSGFSVVSRLAARADDDIAALLPGLWIMFSVNLAVIGLIVAAVSARPHRVSGGIVAIAGLCPLGAAILQMVFLGFIPPTAILLALSGLCFLTAAVCPRYAASGGTDPT